MKSRGQRARPAAWAHYLNGVHNRVHPLFADAFPGLGEIESITVVRTSGVARFDEGAVTAIRRAAPFGAAPDALRSEDGKVHFQWLLLRQEKYACSTYFMMPLLLRSSPAPKAN